MKIIFNERALKYSFEQHPETPYRVLNIYEKIKNDYDLLNDFHLIGKEEITGVHDISLYEKVKNGDFLDYDTPNNKSMFEYAVLSASASFYASELILRGEKSFSLMRPPGHHASKSSAGGFCYFNNIAIGVKNILEKNKKVSILDLDVHHGNGTEDIFLKEKNVIYISIHQTPLYPGTGKESLFNSYNFPVPEGISLDNYISKLKEIEKIIKDFSPDYLAISLGLDTLFSDPLGGLNLKVEDFYYIGKFIGSWGILFFIIFEGGYGKDVGSACREFLRGINEG